MRAYLAHPYMGLESNKKEIERYMDIFEKQSPEFEIVSPIHEINDAYFTLEYLEGIELCFRLLDSCEIILLPKEIFMTSKGCNMEYGYAKGTGKKVLFYTEEGEIC